MLTLFSIYLQFNPKKSELKLLNIVCFVSFLALGGLRFKVGADWYSYENIFKSINNFSDIILAREEKLFMLFMYGSKLIANNYSFFVFIFFAVSFYLKYKVIKKYSPDIFLSLIIYFYTIFLIYDVNGIRQGMAMAIVLFSLSSILDKKLLLFIFLIIIASLFHISAILFFPFYWLSKIKVHKRIMIIIMAISFFIFIPIQSILENSTIIQPLLVLDRFSHYSAYLNNAAGRDISFLSLAIFQRIFTFSLFYFYFNKLKIDDNFKTLLFNGYFISIIVFIFFSFSTEFASRLSFYFKALEIIIIPIIVFSQNKIYNRLLLLLLFVLLSLIGTYRILELPNGGLIPYNSILW